MLINIIANGLNFRVESENLSTLLKIVKSRDVAMHFHQECLHNLSDLFL